MFILSKISLNTSLSSYVSATKSVVTEALEERRVSIFRVRQSQKSGCIMLLRNASNYLPVNKARHPRILESWRTPFQMINFSV